MVKWWNKQWHSFLSPIEKPKLLSYLLNGLKLKLFENENHKHMRFLKALFFFKQKCHLTVCNSPNMLKTKTSLSCAPFFAPFGSIWNPYLFRWFSMLNTNESQFSSHSTFGDNDMLQTRTRFGYRCTFMQTNSQNDFIDDLLGPCRLLCMPSK